jgi:EEF1A lysine methyltransferase 4
VEFAPIRSLLLEQLGPVREQPILELGCGTSSLAARLCIDESFASVTACDASRVAVEASSRRFANVPGLQFVREDARRLSFDAGSFGAIIDKGTLDAICSGEGYDYEGGRVASELQRVLRPVGRWLCISLMPPSVVLPMMQRREWGNTLVRLCGIESHHVYAAVRQQE